MPVAGLFNRARLGFPRHYFRGSGGIGDDLLCTTVFRELRKRGHHRIAFSTQYPDLFQHNPDLDAVVSSTRPRVWRWLHEGLPLVRLGYANHDPATDRDEPLTEHLLAKLCRVAGISGEIQLRPYLCLTPAELAAGRVAENQIAIQSSGMSAAFSMRNKEWGPERFQEVCTELGSRHTIVQVGSIKDPKLASTVDLRGKTRLRQSAAILANSSVFIGLVGFLMHLARAVDCRGVIVYGGRETPPTTGYVANINLTGATPCSPCWLRNRCDYEHECMRMIRPETVIQAAREQIVKAQEPLEIESVVL